MSYEIETHVAGIPCIACISYYPGEHGPINSASLEPNDPEEFCIESIKDRKGYQAEWLERKLTSEDEERIYYDFMEYLKNNP